MEEVRFCEDCKWCNINRMSLWHCLLSIGEGIRCHHLVMYDAVVSRQDKPIYFLCRVARDCEHLCGKEGKYYEPK